MSLAEEVIKLAISSGNEGLIRQTFITLMLGQLMDRTCVVCGKPHVINTTETNVCPECLKKML